MFRPIGPGLAHLVGRHLADRAVGLHGLQLLQTPVQFLQRLPGQLLTRLLWRTGSGVVTDRVHRETPKGPSRW